MPALRCNDGVVRYSRFEPPSETAAGQPAARTNADRKVDRLCYHSPLPAQPIAHENFTPMISGKSCRFDSYSQRLPARSAADQPELRELLVVKWDALA
jgi:hypothetical protein